MDRFLASAPLLRLMSLWLLASPSLPIGRAAAPPPRLLSNPEIARLVAQLGSDSFPAREAATRALRDHEEAAPLLHRALGWPDLEVRRRARRLLDGYWRSRGFRALQQLADLARQGRSGEFVERLVCWRDLDHEGARWEMAGGLARRLYYSPPSGRYRSLFIEAPDDGNPWGDYRGFLAENHPRDVRGAVLTLEYPAKYLACAERIVVPEGGRRSIFAASSGIKLPLAFDCVLLANGPVVVGPLPPSLRDPRNPPPVLMSGVLIADGELRIRGLASSGFLIASGKIICEQPPRGCTLISASDVVVPKGTRIGTRQGENRITRNDPTLLGLVRFYSLAHAGLAVRPSRRGLTITALAPGKPFACAGCRVGDDLLAVNDLRVVQPETLRRALRRLAALGLPADLTIRRAGKLLALRVWVQ